MVDDQLPSDVDVVLLGTGLPESIIAAACARSGLTVLHLDRNDYYGSQWASFNLRAIDEWKIKDNRNGTTNIDPSTLLHDNEIFLPAACRPIIENAYSPDPLRSQDIAEGSDSETASPSQIDCEWRKFSLDILPKLLLAHGDMVKLLCDSNVAKYCEFKCVDRFLNYYVDEKSSNVKPLHVVPISRSELFQSNYPMLEKRRLMNFLRSCIAWRRNPSDMEGFEEYADKPFVDFLDSRGIRDILKSFVVDTLAILHPNATAREGMEAICKFLESVGRFGDSPFLWTLYGSGELPQCFCRLCAVFGGVYCLNRQVEGFAVRDQRVTAVLTQGQRVECKHLITNFTYLPNEYSNLLQTSRVHRAILITDRSIDHDPIKEHISALNLTCFDHSACARLIEVGFEGCAASKGKFIVHITAQGNGTAHNILTPIVDKLYSLPSDSNASGETPRVHWSLFFDLLATQIDSSSLPENMRIVPGINADLDYSEIIKKTRAVFEELWPDRDFLPPSFESEENEEMQEDQMNEYNGSIVSDESVSQSNDSNDQSDDPAMMES